MRAVTTQTRGEPPPPRRWRRRGAIAFLLVGLVGLAWAVRPDPHLARAKELQKQLFGPQAKGLSADERKARFAEYRGEVKRLSANQKWELSAPVREKQKAEMDRYFALSPKEKLKYLDERIDRSEKARKEWGQKGKQTKGGPPGGNKSGSPGVGKAGFAGAPGGGPGAGPRSAEAIEKRRKQFLDRTTPEERAKRDLFRKEMNDRRRQRGLSVRA
jgi:hypothetical protein